MFKDDRRNFPAYFGLIDTLTMRSHVDLTSILLCLNVFILCNKIMTRHLSKGLFSFILKAPSHSQDLFMAPLAQPLPLGASDLVLSIS